MTKPYRPDFENYLDEVRDFGQYADELPDSSLIEFTEREKQLIETFETVLEKRESACKEFTGRIKKALAQFNKDK